MRKTILSIALVLSCIALPASANWRVSDDGSAILEETNSSSALALRCDNNSNTNNRPGWQISVNALDLRQHSTQMEMVFRFPGRSPLRIMGENRNGSVILDSMTQSTQSDLTTLVRQLKAASRVTLTLIDRDNGAAMEPLAFSLRGSGRAIGQVERECR